MCLDSSRGAGTEESVAPASLLGASGSYGDGLGRACDESLGPDNGLHLRTSTRPFNMQALSLEVYSDEQSSDSTNAGMIGVHEELGL